MKNVRKTKNMYSTHCTGSIYLNILKFILNQQPAEHQQSIFFFECRYKYLEVKQSNERQIVQRYSYVFMKTFLQFFKNVNQVFRIFYIYSKRFKIQSTQNVAECNKISRYYEIVFWEMIQDIYGIIAALKFSHPHICHVYYILSSLKKPLSLVQLNYFSVPFS